VLGHVRQQRVPAAGDQAEEWRFEGAAGLGGAGSVARRERKEVRRHVPLQMIDRRKRQLAGRGQGLPG
jgi:hypothetical protein